MTHKKSHLRYNYFLARANRVAGPASARKQDPQKILRICRLVDGLPLGIEMASEMTATHNLDEIGDAIERDLNVLQASAPDLPAQHRSMRHLMATLWQQLPDDERNLTTRCATFENGFSFGDALQATHGLHTESHLRALVNALLERGILRRLHTEASSHTLRTSGLYVLHRLVRQLMLQSQL